MGRQYDCMDICPSFYNLISTPDLLAEELGYSDAEEMYDTFEMTAADLAALKNKLKYWNDVVPKKYGEQDAYIVPIDLLTDPENMLLLDANDVICDGMNGGYNVFLLSTEDWGMI